MTDTPDLPSIGRLSLLFAYVSSAVREPAKPTGRHGKTRRRRRSERPRPTYRNRPPGWRPADEPPPPLPPSYAPPVPHPPNDVDHSGMADLYACCPAAPTQPHTDDCGLSPAREDT